MKRCILLLAAVFLFSLFLPDQVSGASPAVSKCVVGERVAGYLSAYDASRNISPALPWLIAGYQGEVKFQSLGDVVNDDIYLKLGNSSWVSPTKRPVNNQVVDYLARFNLANNENCGLCWANVMWRSFQDRKYHYCSVLIPRYTRGQILDANSFLKISCLSSSTSPCRYFGDPLAKAVDIRGRVLVQPAAGTSCAQTKFFLNGVPSAFGNYNNTSCLWSGAAEYIYNNRGVEAYISPRPRAILEIKGAMTLFDYISPRYCGGNLR